MKEFLSEWGSIIKSITTILTFIGVVWGILKKLNNIGDNIAVIPNMKKSLEDTVKEFKVFKTDHEAYEKMIIELKKTLEEHCAKDGQKQKMALDMARQVLLNEMEKAIKEKEVTVSRKAVIGELYDSYEAKGGNGAVHDLWREYIHLPLK